LKTRDYSTEPQRFDLNRSVRRPETPIEALMMAAPFQDPIESTQELQPLREAVASCIELLSEQSRFIIDAVTSEIISLQELGDRLGVTKTHAWRLRNAAYAELKIIMTENQIIKERLGLDDDEELPDSSGF